MCTCQIPSPRCLKRGKRSAHLASNYPGGISSLGLSLYNKCPTAIRRRVAIYVQDMALLIVAEMWGDMGDMAVYSFLLDHLWLKLKEDVQKREVPIRMQLATMFSSCANYKMDWQSPEFTPVLQLQEPTLLSGPASSWNTSCCVPRLARRGGRRYQVRTALPVRLFVGSWIWRSITVPSCLAGPCGWVTD